MCPPHENISLGSQRRRPRPPRRRRFFVGCCSPCCSAFAPSPSFDEARVRLFSIFRRSLPFFAPPAALPFFSDTISSACVGLLPLTPARLATAFPPSVLPSLPVSLRIFENEFFIPFFSDDFLSPPFPSPRPSARPASRSRSRSRSRLRSRFRSRSRPRGDARGTARRPRPSKTRWRPPKQPLKTPL